MGAISQIEVLAWCMMLEKVMHDKLKAQQDKVMMALLKQSALLQALET